MENLILIFAFFAFFSFMHLLIRSDKPPRRYDDDYYTPRQTIIYTPPSEYHSNPYERYRRDSYTTSLLATIKFLIVIILLFFLWLKYDDLKSNGKKEITADEKMRTSANK